jgi:hypothetical protein
VPDQSSMSHGSAAAAPTCVVKLRWRGINFSPSAR